MLALEGKQLGNYEVVRRLRLGGMGAVYEGKQRTAFDRRVAIKVILGNYASDRDMRRRFAREARTIARLHHPHILPLIEYGDEGGILYLVMPFIEGGTLTGHLRGRPRLLNDISVIFLQLLDAVEYAHEEGLIHRDIKSSNVLLEFRRGAPHAYLADFGLVCTAHQLDRGQGSRALPLEQVPGTPHYMAPERTRGTVTTASDIYALGVLLFQMLTGELPYDDLDEERVIQMHLCAPIPSPRDYDASIYPGLVDVVRSAMAKRVEDRFISIAELRQAFLAAVWEAQAPFDPPAAASSVPAPAPAPSPDGGVQTTLLESRRPEPVPHQLPIRARQRDTDSVHGGRRRVSGPLAGRRRRARPLLSAALVPIVLALLLLIPRALGFNPLPVGFPLLGPGPDAVVAIQAQSRTLQDTYVLTASPSAGSASAASRVVPARQLRVSLLGSRTAAVLQVVTPADVEAASGSLRVELQRQARQQMIRRMRPGEIMAAQPIYSIAISQDSPLGARVSSVTVRVKVSALLIVYRRSDVDAIAVHLLTEQGARALLPRYRERGSPSVSAPHSLKQEQDGTVYLSVSVLGSWTYTFSQSQLDAWKRLIRGASAEAAQAFLKQQAGVAAVRIRLPFGADHLPTATNQIQVLLG